VYPAATDDYMIASTQARERLLSRSSKAKDRIAELEEFVPSLSRQQIKARQATSRAKAIEKIKIEDVQAVEPAEPVHPLRDRSEAKLHRTRSRSPSLQGLRSATVLGSIFTARGGKRLRSSAPTGPARRRCSERFSANSRRTGER